MSLHSPKIFSLTLVEFSGTLALLVLLVGLAIPNYNTLRQRAYNASIRDDFQKFKQALLSESDDDAFQYYLYFSTGGGQARYVGFNGSAFESETLDLSGPIPGPLSHLSLSPDCFPRLLYSYQFYGSNYSYLWLDHEKSSVSYRYIDYQSPLFEFFTGDQVIQK